MKTTDRYGTVLRLYDNGGRSCDRYTIIPPRWAREYREQQNRRLFAALGANDAPFHPQGVGMHVTALPGPHLGKRVHWRDLPSDVQRFARQNFPEFCPGKVAP